MPAKPHKSEYLTMLLSNSVKTGDNLPRGDECLGRGSEDTPNPEPFANGDIRGGGGNRQQTSLCTECFEAKTTELVGQAIDAQVGRTLYAPPVARRQNDREAETAFGMKF